MSTNSTTTLFNLAKSTFEMARKSNTSSDYIKNKKSKLIYCNEGQCGRLSKTNSYNEMNLYNNGKLLNTIIEFGTVEPHRKHDLINNLYSTMDLSGALVITDISNNEPTCIDISLIPFYESYNIDSDASLFGDTECSVNNFVRYMTPNLDYVAPTTVLYNRSSYS